MSSGPDGSFCEAPDWLAEGGIEVEQALRMMTIDAAYALLMDDVVGSLKPGKFADLIVLSENPTKVNPDELIDLKLLMTMVGGRTEYCIDESVCTITQPSERETDVVTPPDVIFYNGHIITIETDMPSAEAVAVLGDEITHVGTDVETLRLAGSDTQLIDLGGRTLLPGFIDWHRHPFDLDSSASLDESQQYILEGGLTTIGDANATPDKLERFLAALESTELRVRTNLYLGYNTKCNGLLPDDWFLEQHRELAPMLRFAGIKLIGDPAGPNTQCRWAAMSVPLQEWLQNLHQADAGGDLLISEEEMTRLFTKYQALGYQVIIHARGDVVVDTALNAIENALDGGPNVYRHRIEHNDFIRPDQLSHYGELEFCPRSVVGRSHA